MSDTKRAEEFPEPASWHQTQAGSMVLMFVGMAVMGLGYVGTLYVSGLLSAFAWVLITVGIVLTFYFSGRATGLGFKEVLD